MVRSFRQTLAAFPWTLGALSCLLLTVTIGCDRRNASAGSTSSATAAHSSTSRPATAPAVLAAATTAPTSGPSSTQAAQRPPAVLIIDQQRREFPSAILHLRHKNDRLVVILMSDDPKAAVDENYSGNSFYLEMPVEAADAKELSMTVWHYEAPSSDRTDSPDGIFLDGNKKQLQPSNVTVHFEADATAGDEPKVMAVDVSGNFLLFDTHDDTIPPKLVPVVGHLAAELRTK
jgi:hypothetical protein